MKIKTAIILSVSLFSMAMISLFIWSIKQIDASHQVDNLQFIAPSDDLSFFIRNEVNEQQQGVIVSEGVEFFEILQINNLPTYTLSRIPTGGQLNRQPQLIVFFVSVVGVGAGTLIGYLLVLQKKQQLQILTEINGDELNYKGEAPALCEKIKKQQSRHIIDYQRLQTYLSHEQKNVLAILRTELKANDQSELARKVDRLSQNMDDVLTLSDSIENSKKVEVDIALVTAMVCDTYRSIYPNITFTFDEDADLIIMGRERWISRAVTNILDNGIKYGENRPIDVTVSKKNHTVILSVRDNGVGMERRVLDKIFNPHFRVSELHHDGYGIGLSLVSHVCDLCEGIVWVDSVQGKGSTFYLSFPAINNE